MVFWGLNWFDVGAGSVVPCLCLCLCLDDTGIRISPCIDENTDNVVSNRSIAYRLFLMFSRALY